MIKRISIALVTLTSLALASSASARPEKGVYESSDQLFQRIDLDRNASIDEAELLYALRERADKQAQRLARLELEGSSKLAGLQERMEADSLDGLMGTPESAAPFIMANFDDDGDWSLNQVEISQAFSSIRKWRSEERKSAS